MLGEIDNERTSHRLPGLRRATASRQQRYACFARDLCGSQYVGVGPRHDNAKRLPIDLDSLEWNDLAPGVRCHVLEATSDGFPTRALIWAEPGAE